MVIRPLLVGHRGASALAPENTRRAFEVAIEHGLDMAELDVHLSRDGQLMVIHDAHLERVAGRPDQVADCTADELAAFDVPRLTDVFELARGRLGIYVELKGARTGAALAQLVIDGAAEGVPGHRRLVHPFARRRTEGGCARRPKERALCPHRA